VNSAGTVIGAIRIGGTGFDLGKDVKIGPDGNIVVIGGIAGTGWFDDSTSRTATGTNDNFVAKYNSSLTLLWAQVFDDAAVGEAKGLAVATDGIYVGGHFTGSFNFAGKTLLTLGKEILMLKYDTNGNQTWAFQSTLAVPSEGISMDIGTVGGVQTLVVTGDFSASTLFGSLNLPILGSYDVFVMGLNPTNGSVLWGVSAGGSLEEYGDAVQIGPDQKVYFTGRYASNNAQFGQFALPNSGRHDIFTARVSVQNAGQATLTVTSPVSGDNWTAGTIRTIRWAMENAGNTVQIRLYKGGLLQRTIESSYTDAVTGGNYSWNIPPDLETGNDYQVRVTSTTAAGADDFSDFFSIMGPPRAPSNLQVNLASSSELSLTWQSNSTDETSFQIERAGSAAGPFTQIASVGSGVQSYLDRGLQPGTQYCYRVIAMNNAGSSAPTNIECQTTAEEGPDAPKDLTTEALAGDRISLTWEDVADNETGYRIERRIGAGGTFEVHANIASNSESFLDINLTPATEYCYRIVATNNAGDSPPSNESCATTLDVAPGKPANLVAQALGSNRISLSWERGSANETGFRVERKAGQGGVFELIATLPAGTQTYSSTNLTPLTEYCYRVIAFNSVGSSLPSDEACATTADTAPASPSNLVASAIALDRIRIAWTQNSENETGFRIERRVDNGPYSELVTLAENVTSYNDDSVNESSEYCYRVLAFNSFGDSDYSNDDCARTTVLIPDPPSNARASALSDTAISIAWQDNSANEAGFRIERRPGSAADEDFVEIAVLDSTNDAYVDNGLMPETTYCYRILAYNAHGMSLYSNVICTTTSKPDDLPPAAPQGLTVVTAGVGAATLSWSANPEADILRYRIYGDTVPGGTSLIDSVDGASGTTRLVSGLVPGARYYFRLTAVDAALQESGFSNEADVVIEVGNAVPQVSNPLPDLSLTVGGQNVVLDIEQTPAVFSDPDSDPLIYSVNTSRQEVATVSLSGSIVTIGPVTTGMSTITLTANDQVSGSVSTEFVVTVFPKLDIGPPITSQPREDQQISIQVEVNDGALADQGRIFFRRGGDLTFSQSDMQKSGTQYSAVILAGTVTNRGVEFYVEIADTSGQSITRHPASGVNSLQVEIPDLEWRITRSGSAENAYLIMSFPMQPDEDAPRTLLEDDLGQYSRSDWRFFSIDANETRTELPDIQRIVPGKGYWLIVKEAGRRISTGSGMTTRTDEPFSVVLQPGWNLIGNPFYFNVPVSKVTMSDTSQIVMLRAYQGTWNELNAPVSTLVPFEGYAVQNNSQQSVTLHINPNLSASTSKTASPQGLFDNALWDIKIRARAHNAADVDNIIGIHGLADNAFDVRDLPEPPPIGEYVSVYLPHDEWHQVATRFCSDFRREVGEGQVWNFEIASNIGDKVELDFEGIENVPGDLQIALVDPSSGAVYDLRASAAISIAAAGEIPKPLHLYVGSASFVQERAASLPSEFYLAQNYPNPFNPVTTIAYGLTEADHVTIVVYNILGEEVTTLISNQPKQPGNHSVVWDGRDRYGKNVGSGVYIYRFVSSTRSVATKMILVK
jgi:fibronectin type 3 domain-containing protein